PRRQQISDADGHGVLRSLCECCLLGGHGTGKIITSYAARSLEAVQGQSASFAPLSHVWTCRQSSGPFIPPFGLTDRAGPESRKAAIPPLQTSVPLVKSQALPPLRYPLTILRQFDILQSGPGWRGPNPRPARGSSVPGSMDDGRRTRVRRSAVMRSRATNRLGVIDTSSGGARQERHPRTGPCQRQAISAPRKRL